MYKYIFNIVGVKKCISLYGGYSWPDLLCGIKGGCEDVFRRGKYIFNICGFCTFALKSFYCKVLLQCCNITSNEFIYCEVGVFN